MVLSCWGRWTVTADNFDDNGCGGFCRNATVTRSGDPLFRLKMVLSDESCRINDRPHLITETPIRTSTHTHDGSVGENNYLVHQSVGFRPPGFMLTFSCSRSSLLPCAFTHAEVDSDTNFSRKMHLFHSSNKWTLSYSNTTIGDVGDVASNYFTPPSDRWSFRCNGEEMMECPW